MSDDKFVFMLRRLLDTGLCDDDRREYALVSYPREVVSQAAIVIVSDYANRIDSIPLDNKKRVKTVIENLAVALSLKTEHVKLMETARSIYRKWFTEPSIFGDEARQNRFIRRLVKQLSMPFEMREPENPDLFKSEYNALLNNILGDLKFVVEHLGKMLSKETWVTLLNVSLGICEALLEFDFSDLLTKPESAKLRQKSVDLCFTVMELCGLKDEDMWDRLKEYTLKWSGKMDFVKVWGHQIDMMFVFMNVRIYQQPLEAQMSPIKTGVYSVESPVSDEMVKFIFRKVLGMIDSSKTREKPEILREFASTLSRVTGNAKVIAEFDRTIAKKYPANAFLKLFGRFLTEIPQIDEMFDDAVLAIIDSLLVIIANFQIDYQTMAPRLIAYVIKRATATHMQVAASFLNRAGELFRHNSTILPLVADHSLMILPQLNTTRAARLISDAFWSNVNSLFISSTELVKNCGGYESQISASFEMIWKTTALLPIRFQLLCFAPMSSLNIIDKLMTIFSEGGLRQLTSDSSSIPFLSSVVLLIGVLVRFDPSFIDVMNQNHILKQILETTVKVDTRRIENYDLVISAVLQMILNIITYCSHAFAIKENVEALLVYMSELKPLTSQYAQKSQPSSLVALILSLYDQIYAKMAIRMPPKDLFSRRLNSTCEINENSLTAMFQLVNPKVHYFSIGKSLLISLIETDQINDPILLFVRGAHGKTAFKVTSVMKFNDKHPKLSSEIEQIQLPCPPEVDIHVKTDSQVNLLQAIDVECLEFIQKTQRETHGSEFSTWLGSKYSFYTPFNEITPHHRPKFIDFLSGLGLLSDKNKNEIRLIDDMQKLIEVVTRLDMYDALPLLPVSICHLLPSDANSYRQGVLEFVPEQTRSRMTPLLKKFLREIGEPFSMPSNVQILPPLRTTFPVISSLQSLVALLSPTIAETDEGAQMIYNIGETSSMKIIFNETSFDVKVEKEKKPRQHVLAVTPSINGLYHVTQLLVPKDVFSPFAEEQTLSAQSLAFYIAICFEQSIRTNAQRTMPNLAKLRKEIIASLAEEPCDPSLPGKIAMQAA